MLNVDDRNGSSRARGASGADVALSGEWAQPALYVQVRTRILEAMRAGEWRPGETIPPEKKLCERFGVSIGTLRKAVDELTTAGMLIRRQGRGTYVAKHSHDRYLFFFFHLVGQDGHKEYPEVEFASLKSAKADEYAAQSLDLKKGDALWHLTNRLSLQGEIVSLDEIYLPKQAFSTLTEDRLRVRQTTLYQMYQDEFGLTVMRAAERVRAVVATSDQARRLKVKTGTPLLQIVRIAYTIDDRPVELRYSYVQTDHCEYRPDTYVKDRSGA